MELHISTEAANHLCALIDAGQLNGSPEDAAEELIDQLWTVFCDSTDEGEAYNDD